jgi:hypothetical protein
VRDILVGTDLSPSSERALGRAIGLAVRFHARLTVLHVVDDRLPDDIADALRLRAEQSVRAQLAADSSAAGLDVGVEIAIGDPFRRDPHAGVAAPSRPDRHGNALKGRSRTCSAARRSSGSCVGGTFRSWLSRASRASPTTASPSRWT